MAELLYRAARSTDADDIRKLIHSVHINPFDLNWRRFILASTANGMMVGCAQIKEHFDGSHELASLAVEPKWRRNGIARNLIKQLLTAPYRPLYLTCRPGLGSFYEKFGFRVCNSDALPRYFRFLKAIINIFNIICKKDLLLIMSYDG